MFKTGKKLFILFIFWKNFIYYLNVLSIVNMNENQTFSLEIKPELAKKLKKLQKKNPLLFARVKKKIFEIIENPTHYKPLKYGV